MMFPGYTGFGYFAALGTKIHHPCREVVREVLEAMDGAAGGGYALTRRPRLEEHGTGHRARLDDDRPASPASSA
ncbi:hypothetical protein BH18GEM1_BH18GEM1_19480 [soil metagenome]